MLLGLESAWPISFVYMRKITKSLDRTSFSVTSCLMRFEEQPKGYQGQLKESGPVIKVWGPAGEVWGLAGGEKLS